MVVGFWKYCKDKSNQPQSVNTIVYFHSEVSSVFSGIGVAMGIWRSGQRKIELEMH